MPFVEPKKQSTFVWTPPEIPVFRPPFEGESSATKDTVFPSLLRSELSEGSNQFYVEFLNRLDILRRTAHLSAIYPNIKALLEFLKSNQILIPQPIGIEDYLLRHSDMIEVVQLATLLTLDSFKSNSQISLEVYQDPEVDDEHLTVCIRQIAYDENISDTIDEIFKKYEKELTGKSGWLVVMTDFQPPK